jgi:lantibiotic modifying enzyme
MGLGVLFIALHQRTGNDRWAKVARGIIEDVVRPAMLHIAANPNRVHQWVVSSPSAFDMPLSGAYLCAYADSTWGTNYTAECISPIVSWCTAGLELESRYGLLSGAAGAIRLLLTLHEFTQDPRLYELSKIFGNTLLRDAVSPAPGHLAWREAAFGDLLGGMAHGTAGIAWALGSLGSASSLDRYSQACDAALLYDDSLYDAQQRAWRDLRQGYSLGGRQVGWCNGAAGIALARMSIDASFGTRRQIEVVQRAIELLLQEPARSDCLCHGTLGVLEVIRSAARYYDRQDWELAAVTMLKEVWSAANARGFWRCGAQDKVVSMPGIYMGMAGIAYGLLWHSEPLRTPSVLRFGLPRSVGSDNRATQNV